MKTRALGASGLQVSELGLGCNHFGGRVDEAATRAVVQSLARLNTDWIDLYCQRRSHRMVHGCRRTH